VVKSTTGVFKLKPHHGGISVPDIEASIAWYQNMLGFTVIKRMNIDAIPAKIAFMKHGNFCIELFEVPGASSLPECRRNPNEDLKVHGNKHIAFTVENIYQVIAILKKRGVDIAMELTEIGPGEWACFIRDNAGNLIELMSPW